MLRLARRARGLAALALSGCVQAPLADAPCPCTAPDRCCVALDLCLPPDLACPAATLEIIATSPARLPRSGGTLTLVVDPPVTAPEVRVAGGPCVVSAVDDATIRCAVGPNRDGIVERPVYVRGQTADGPREGFGIVRQAVPPFVDMTAALRAPGGHSITVLQLEGAGPDLIFARASTELPAGLGSHWAWDGPWAWRDVSAGGLVDALPALVSITPVHLDADAARDLVVNWGRARVQNRQLLRALDGASGFRTTLPLDVPALGESDDVRVLPITWQRRTALLGVRGATAALERSVFLVDAGREVIPPPFEPPADWTADPAWDLALVDADHDGQVDVFGCADAPWLLRRDGDRFASAPAYLPPILLYCQAVATGDLDLDGRLDLVIGGPAQADRPQNNFQGLRILLGHPDGYALAPQLAPATPCPAPVWVGAAIPSGAGGVAILDADLDGDLDLLVVMPSKACPAAPQLYRNAVIPSGVFGFEPEALEMGWRHVSVGPVVVADLDADGDEDVVFNGWGTTGRAGIWRNTAVEGGAAGRSLEVRVEDAGRPVFGAIVEVDLADPVDFAPPHLRVAISGHTAVRISDGPVRLAIGEHPGPMTLRVRFPDGETRIEALPAGATAITVERGR